MLCMLWRSHSGKLVLVWSNKTTNRISGKFLRGSQTEEFSTEKIISIAGIYGNDKYITMLTVTLPTAVGFIVTFPLICKLKKSIVDETWEFQEFIFVIGIPSHFSSSSLVFRWNSRGPAIWHSINRWNFLIFLCSPRYEGFLCEVSSPYRYKRE